jgi:catechol 2,3-dioxygenase-like lactoylglutathione lyase family enzyme
MVKDLEPTVAFYTQNLGFRVEQEGSPNFAMLSRGNLELVLSTPFGPRRSEADAGWKQG